MSGTTHRLTLTMALLLAACGGGPGPGDPGYPYNVAGVYAGRLVSFRR